MAHKRKRSADISPVSLSSFGTMATPEAQSPASFPHSYAESMELDTAAQRSNPGWDFSSVGRVKTTGGSGDWSVRTRKRVRDNRPDERVIHENTINKLFTAQRKHPHAAPVMSDTLLPSHPAPATSKSQKSTLHAFWKLPPPPVQPIFQQQQQAQLSNAPHCEDCDALLQTEVNGMDVDMEIDSSFAGNPFSCSGCGRNVCGTCAVVSDTRHCLQCATSARHSVW